jgi:hypothetical protein
MQAFAKARNYAASPRREFARFPDEGSVKGSGDGNLFPHPHGTRGCSILLRRHLRFRRGAIRLALRRLLGRRLGRVWRLLRLRRPFRGPAFIREQRGGSPPGAAKTRPRPGGGGLRWSTFANHMLIEHRVPTARSSYCLKRPRRILCRGQPSMT